MIAIGLGLGLSFRRPQLAIEIPVVALTEAGRGNGTVSVSWTGGDTVNIYVDGVLTLSNQTSPVTISGLTNFTEYDIQAKVVIGAVEGDFSNTISAYPTYGPITVPVNPDSVTITVPSGSWTVGTILWGPSVALSTGFSMATEDFSAFWEWMGTYWKNTYTEADDTAVTVSGNLVLFNAPSEPSLTIWNGLEP